MQYSLAASGVSTLDQNIVAQRWALVLLLQTVQYSLAASAVSLYGGPRQCNAGLGRGSSCQYSIHWLRRQSVHWIRTDPHPLAGGGASPETPPEDPIRRFPTIWLHLTRKNSFILGLIFHLGGRLKKEKREKANKVVRWHSYRRSTEPKPSAVEAALPMVLTVSLPLFFSPLSLTYCLPFLRASLDVRNIMRRVGGPHVKSPMHWQPWKLHQPVW